MTPRICVSILPKAMNEALKLTNQAEQEGADLIEVRLDRLKSVAGLAALAKNGKTPKIATNKLAVNQGYFQGTEAEQKRTLLTAAKNGFNYVDIDLSASDLKDFVAEAREHSAKVIVSFHDFNRALKPAELTRVLDRELACGADVCKIVTAVKKLEDNLTVLNFTSAACKKADVVCFGMGELGKASRLLSPLFGGFLTFAALEHGSETAPGQMTIREMRTIYKLLGV